MIGWVKRMLGCRNRSKKHICDFRRPIMHNGKYWMQCTEPNCKNIRDSYLYDGTKLIVKI